MKIYFHPKSKLEKFSKKVFDLLVDNFPQTFYVGGMVRDLLLKRPVTDIDIATKATPEEIIQTLSNAGINYESKNKQFGVVAAKSGKVGVEITTFRKDSYGNSRYPKITFIKTPRQDSQRRDFTINSLYLSPINNNVFDFHHGLNDINLKTVKFIGISEKRILEDPLRIIRALRFALVLNFSLDSEARKAIEKNFSLVQTLTKSRLEQELKKIKNPIRKKIILRAVGAQNLLDIK